MLPTRVLALLACALALAGPAFAEEKEKEVAPDDPTKWRLSVHLGDLYPSMLIANAVRKPKDKRPEMILGDLHGPISVRVYNDKPGTVVQVQVEVDELAQPTRVRYTLEKTGYYFLRPQVRWKYAKLRELDQPIPTTLKVSVWRDGKLLSPSQQRPIRVHSVSDVPYLYRNPAGEWYDITWLLAAFVNEESPLIDGILKEALDTGMVKRFVGYQAGDREVQQQVGAVYTALKKRGIVYSSTTQTSSSDLDLTLTQHVRFVGDSLKYTQANCIDGVVLMASILRRIEIDPLIIVGPGHAMLGYHLEPGRTGRIGIVETTLIATGDFDSAVKAGGARFDQWKVQKDPRFRVIEVAKWRDEGVMPISR